MPPATAAATAVMGNTLVSQTFLLTRTFTEPPQDSACA
jgi:hypothetical protein